jgi:CRISPR-associated endonuclease/helicase Cas3
MTPDLFPQFYQAVHGYQPFPWQSRLARQVAEEGWPGVLALPTAAGKTSAIDVAVFSLALQAGKPLRDRTAPLRIFFVIDRRLVVDQAVQHARKLKRALEEPGDNPLLREVGNALRQFGGQGPLHVAAMRGGMYRDDTWTRSPNQPTVCVSTVDQVGSRLLFRGYGLSEYAQPVQAALTGNDALYLLDEAHLSQPFLETLRAVGAYRAGPWAERAGGGPFQVVEISATPFSDQAPFGLEEEDRKNEELRTRLGASKPARLVETARFEAEAAKAAKTARDGPVKVVGVVVNRVASAREIFERLPGVPFEDKVLLTGRIRPWDRDGLLGRCLDRMRAGRTRTPEDRPLFVVATMTVEVGADLDFDHLVTEAAPLASLRQRFGRLDRLGRFQQAKGAVMLRKARGPDPVYGEELPATWAWLRQLGEEIDFGVNALTRRIEEAAVAPPAPTPHPAPVLFPAHLDAWVQTSPAPEPSPDVAPFLHGTEALDTADVQVVWRADLRGDNEDDWLETVAAAPPRSREAMPLPVDAVRRWLRQEPAAPVADVEGAAAEPGPPGPGRMALRWYGPESDRSGPVPPNAIRPGDTLVVPSEYGGADAFGWNPTSQEPVADVGDLCINDMANAAPVGVPKLIRLRLYDGFEDGLVPPTPPEGAGEEPPPSLAALVREVQKRLDDGEDADAVDAAVEKLLARLTARPPAHPLMGAVVRQLAGSTVRAAVYPAGVALTARVRPGFFRPGAEPPEPEEDATDVDDASSLRGGTDAPARVELDRHIEGVVAWTRSFATSLGLEEDQCAVLARAARLHDLGKADWRFQYLLYGDEPGDVLLAKSGGDPDAHQQRQVRKRANLPDGFRHEFVSVALVCNHAGHLLAGLDEENRRLARFLVGTHHGRGRPFAPVIVEQKPERVTLEWDGRPLAAQSDHGLWRLDSGWADDFWCLVRRHGYWGLAYLEALLRLADGARSAEEQHLGREQP